MDINLRNNQQFYYESFKRGKLSYCRPNQYLQKCLVLFLRIHYDLDFQHLYLCDQPVKFLYDWSEILWSDSDVLFRDCYNVCGELFQ